MKGAILYLLKDNMVLKSFFLVVVSMGIFITGVSGKNKSTTPSSEYDKAERLAIEANNLLKAGEVIKADQAIRESIKLYPKNRFMIMQERYVVYRTIEPLIPL